MVRVLTCSLLTFIFAIRVEFLHAVVWTDENFFDQALSIEYQKTRWNGKFGQDKIKNIVKALSEGRDLDEVVKKFDFNDDGEENEYDFRGINLSNKDLRNEETGSTVLNFANFSYAFMKNVILDGAFLKHADFSNANLREARFIGAHLENVNFSHAFLFKADFSYAHLCKIYSKEAVLTETTNIGASFKDATLIDVVFNNADLSYADFTGASLTNVNLKGANVSKAILKQVNLKGTNINETQSFDEADADLKTNFAFFCSSLTSNNKLLGLILGFFIIAIFGFLRSFVRYRRLS